MESVKIYDNGIDELKSRFKALSEHKHFDELYTLLVMLIAFLGWCISSSAGIAIILLIALIVLLLTNDLSYVIPNTIFAIFTINVDFKSNRIPEYVLIIGGIYLFFLILQILLNGIHLSKMKSYIGISGLAIANMIPLFYADIPEGMNIFYLFFFIDAIYFLVYLVFVNAIKRDAIGIISHTMAWLGVLISFECIVSVIRLKPELANTLLIYYDLGWSDSSAAGVMICMSIPFAYLIIGKLSKPLIMTLGHLKGQLMAIGIILTASKGAFIFGMLEIIILIIALFWFSEHKKEYRYITGFYLAIVTCLFMIFCVPAYMLGEAIGSHVFVKSIENGDKITLWRRGIDEWSNNPLTLFFGSGFAAVMKQTKSGAPEIVVFHSAIVETLVVGGLLALLFLMIHYIEKYRAVRSMNSTLFKVTMLTGLIGVDLYSAIDNTYHMYYCMIPFVITLAVIDSTIYLNDKKMKREFVSRLYSEV